MPDDRQSQNVANIPTWIIKVGGTAVPPETMDKLISAEVDSSLEVPDMAVLRFHDNEVTLVNDTLFEPGKEMEISAKGPGSRSALPLFKGEIVGLEPSFEADNSATLTVRAFDKRHRLNRETRTRNFKQVTDSDIVSTVVSGASLTAAVDATTQVREVVFQQNQTDLEFLTELARRNGYEMWFDGSALNFKKPPPTSTTAATLEWGINLKSFRPRLSLAGQVNEVIVRGWDNKQAKELVGTAKSSKSHPQTGIGKSGGVFAQSKISAAKWIEVSHLVHNEYEAAKLAQSILDDINSESLEADGTALGDPSILAGKVVEIKSVGAKFSGRYPVSSATHVYSTELGYEVHFRVSGARPPTVASLMGGSSDQSAATTSAPRSFPAAMVALVTNNNDPDNMGRVKLKFPWFADDAESNWSRIAMPGAGKDRGFFVLPEIGDEVLVAFLSGDMNYPVVLGGLYNAKAQPPLTSSDAVAEGKVVNRMFKSRTGHIIQLEEKSGAESITIQDGKNQVSVKMDAANKQMTSKSEGKYDVQSQGDITVESKTAKVTVKATGDVVIQSNGNVNIKAAANVSIEGNAQVNVKGNGPVTVQSSAILTLKGSMVQIN
ncbi:MAG: VgrG-related protein [Anaerolineae bacterium]|nr:VgrG-related protein [Anaerolineae bacterium]